MTSTERPLATVRNVDNFIAKADETKAWLGYFWKVSEP